MTPLRPTLTDRQFYARPTVVVARELLGAELHRRLPGGEGLLSGYIVEAEAYTQDDPACHAFRGIKERCRVMFGEPGHAYVYFIYGMYYCLNVVTEPAETPGAVLIRAVQAENTNGPGKLCRQWQIDRTDNGVDLLDAASGLWITPGLALEDEDIVSTTRVGLSVARERPWRFYIRNNPYVSDYKKRRQSPPKVRV